MATSKQVKTKDITSEKANLSEVLNAQNMGYLQRVSEDVLEVYLQNGSFNSQESWFLKDNGGQEYVVLPQHILKTIISLLRKAHEDRLKVELERDIISLTPIDFDDVMSVATSRVESLRNKDGSLPHINTMQLIKDIKKEHPNLFLNLDSLIGGRL